MSYIEKEVERSIPELQVAKLLDKLEIRQILKQRTHYAENKFRYQKQDFLRCIEYEKKLYRLMMLRAQKKKNIEETEIRLIRDNFVKRMNGLYNQALSRYGSDRHLWFASFEFAQKFSERISRSKFLRALLLHPDWIEAWIKAADYEYEWNKNPSNARLLYQRAIALNPESVELYIAFFKMEINVIKENLKFSVKQENEQGFDDNDNENDNFNWQNELLKIQNARAERESQLKKDTNTLEKNSKDVSSFDISKFDGNFENLINMNENKQVKKMIAQLKEKHESMKKKEKEQWLLTIYSNMEVPKLIFRFALKNLDPFASIEDFANGKYDEMTGFHKITIENETKNNEMETENDNENENDNDNDNDMETDKDAFHARYIVLKQLLLSIPSINTMSNEDRLAMAMEDEKERNERMSMFEQFSKLKEYCFNYLESNYFYDPIIVELIARRQLEMNLSQLLECRSVELSGFDVFERALLSLETKMIDKNEKLKYDMNDDKTKAAFKARMNSLKIGMQMHSLKYLESRMEHYVKLKSESFDKLSNDIDELDESEKLHAKHILKVYSQIMDYLINKAMLLFEKMQENGTINGPLFEQWICLLSKTDQWTKAIKIVQLGLKSFEKDANLWKLYSQLYFGQMRSLTMKLSDMEHELSSLKEYLEQEDDDIEIDRKEKMEKVNQIKEKINDANKLHNDYYIQSIAACKKGIDSVLSPKESGILWRQMIDIVLSKLVFISQKCENEEIDDKWKQLKNKQIKIVQNVFKQSIEQCNIDDSLKLSYLDWISIYFVNNENINNNPTYALNCILKELHWFALETIHCNQNVYQMIFSIYNRLLMFCGNLNNQESLALHQGAKSQIIRTFERCVSDHGKYSADVWIWYLQWARKHMAVSQSSLVYKRAMRTLNKFECQRFLHATRIN